MWKRLVVSTVVVVAAGCGGVLKPVEAIVPQTLVATTHQPRVVWVLDHSGSMEEAWGATGTTTRMTIVRTWLRGLGPQMQGIHRHGLVSFPDGSSCGLTSSLEVAVPPEGLPSTFVEVMARADAFMPQGGSPIAGALNLVTDQLAEEPQAETFVVLLTDGLPNCNPRNSNTCANPTACRCGSSSCGTPASTTCSLICLDDLGLITAGQALARRGFQLMVVGVGPALTSEGAALYSAMDPALSRTCSSDRDCRTGTTCEVARGLCTERLYAVESEPQFALPTARLLAAVDRSMKCHFWFDAPLDPARLTVQLEGRVLTAGADGLGEVSAHRVVVRGAACEQLRSQPGLRPTFTEAASR